jgi:soluble lytic murein transglycosylase-like protein
MLALRLALTAALCLPAAVRAGELYSFTDKEGTVHFTNVPTDGRYKRVSRAHDSGGGVYVKVQGRSGGSGGAVKLPTSGKVQEYDQIINEAAKQYNLPVALLKAVMAVESNFNPHAVSDKGACGLMQLMPQTAKEMYVEPEKIHEPAHNIEGGARYLRILANMYNGDLVKTVAAYNAGPEAVKRAGGGIPDIPETREYVRRVLALYQSYKAGL